jgi:hypothetical protein
MLLVVGLLMHYAWGAFASPQRRDGNLGHTTIDFGGQWLMGRMLVQGLGQHLYHRNYQREVLREAFPQEDEPPDSARLDEDKGKHDADNFMTWFMGKDTAPGETPDQPAVGGPLYPPIHALVMYPLANLRPALAYRVMQGLIIVMALVAGWGIRQLTHGRIWWTVAVPVLMLFPAYVHGLNLGQNSAFMLAILVWGWLLITRGRQVAGGMVWGLLAFKPVWAAAFFLVPVLTGRWRVCLAMIITGAALAVATLPLVGFHSWLEWLWIGKQASNLYGVDENWVFLSRDILTIPKRWLVDFQAPDTERFSWPATILGWGLVCTIFAVTVLLAVYRRDRTRVVEGPGAAFLLLGAYFSCYHFMYYDSLLAALPVALFFADPGRFARPRLIAVVALGTPPPDKSLEEFYQPRLVCGSQETVRLPWSHRGIFVLSSLSLSLLAFLLISETLLPALGIAVSVSMPTHHGLPVPMPLKYSTGLAGTPFSTFGLIIFWFWAGWIWLRSPASDSQDKKAEVRQDCRTSADC